MKMPSFETLRLALGFGKSRKGAASQASQPFPTVAAPVFAQNAAAQSGARVAMPTWQRLTASLKTRPANPVHTGAVPFLGEASAVSAQGARLSGAVLTGELVFASLGKDRPDGAYTAQPSRVLTPWWNIRSPRHLHVWVHSDLPAAGTTHRFAFALDSILRYGRQQKGRCIIFNGFHTAERTYLNFYKFKDGELVETGERLILAKQQRYETEVRMLLDSLNNQSDTRFIWTAPLLPITYPGLVSVGEAIFARRRVHQLTTGLGRTRDFKSLLPVLACALALAAYGAAMVSQLAAFSHAQAGYRHLTSIGPANAESLDVLKARETWLTAPNPMLHNAQTVEPLLAAISVHDAWRVKALTVNAVPKDSASAAQTTQQGQAAPDLEVVIRVPRTDGVAPLDQAHPILAQLADATGLNLRLAAGGWQEQQDATGKVLILTIQTTLPEHSDASSAASNGNGANQ
ncbi:hypothetical protein [Trinickia mobilis]|uniref:hypothetical protein n=1 Tax=Trinickia mobilis TaxID=2816356 RepID=UPI001A8C7E2F|nr:hypothetical protein [Trinickia mobilis]